MDVIQGAKERARAEVAQAIKEQARVHLATEGPGRLSLRAVARELGMVSSALYRYFPSRDELLTALIVDAYDAIGGAAESAYAQAAGSSPWDAWHATCKAVRAWALAHPHEYALIYGSPVPGYDAPADTVAPASRVALVLLNVLEKAHAAGALAVAAQAADAEAVLSPDVRALLTERSLPAGTVISAAAAWAQLFGLISFEVLGQFNQVIDDREALFTQGVTALARQVGLSAER
ncbi:TetR/AcrR family transcriptional regulator [Streptomyces acidiscabies]|uniref:TetR/AcrR family transcriptional regulator n=1 Tax=Streptomyces acidiscabies TaxID=42234 RepID=A0AAP6BAS9_9ACTN|nr:TetR/AcrR family transcriptional regulator [Streptomyces acidiscabies]MBP5935111.1 helix-turn-helix transcriptional regulator [Streptomyces sp. LBUM 1476]MBZ3917091.1 TetR/AcrR family transcriptional regulator [Streptomyces acidiscabies]MDX2961331.1 TetR/AcrR family transcriptional regulator [Streptomyces acidiscabies]MDX3022689.1 TetR/AcrR family transcriptional regulator [Streptomyces acidiscabies]MDX3792053.1 TetR/AcrR family transcriptional regulator [Streptomyces acidiscabies]